MCYWQVDDPLDEFWAFTNIDADECFGNVAETVGAVTRQDPSIAKMVLIP